MSFQFTHSQYLWLLIPAAAWVFWLAWKTDVQTSRWRWAVALTLRCLVLLVVVLALAGLQWRRPMFGLNVFFLLDRSDSIPSPQQEAARRYVNDLAAQKKKNDRAGVLVFGTEAAIESSAQTAIDLQKINAVVRTERTDLAAAIRLGAAAFPETGQKRLVVMSDGNENMGDAVAALLAAKPLGVTLDVVPLGVQRGNDVSVQKLGLPPRVKKGQPFEGRIYIQADAARKATVRVYRNDQPLGEHPVDLTPGKNLYTFTETLSEPGFYSYNVQLDAPGDPLPQNNRATGFTQIRGDPRIVLVSSDPQQDQTLASALRSSRLEVNVLPFDRFPTTLSELQSYDAIFISNLAAGDIGTEGMKLIESGVRDFGVGLVCVGGDQTYAAGGYRGTPLETTLPVDMELDSKKVIPPGAIVLVMHGMEFMNGNAVARDCAMGVLDALGPQDEMGVVLWDGSERWLFPLTKVGDKKRLGAEIAGMNQGDLPSFQGVMTRGYEGLRKSNASLKHMIIFSDGDPTAPSAELMQQIVEARITVTTVLIAGHSGPDTMISIAAQGRGRFYNVQNAAQLPQIFIKETAVILKSAIFEEPFTPTLAIASEVVRGIGSTEFPQLNGYVCATPKSRAEVPLVSDKGDPILAHWQFGLGRAVAFTSDAKARWARQWLGWDKYRQFWSQIAQWSLRRLENTEYTTEVDLEGGEGRLHVEALNEAGDYRNFLNLQAVVVGPKGERQLVRLEQTGPGRYEARFPTREVGSYLLNIMETQNGKLVGSQVVGASINYSPEFTAPEPNLPLLKALADVGGGKLLDFTNPLENPFLHDRKQTYQPRDLWEWLLRAAVLLFTLDVGVRRIQLGREEWEKAFAWLKRRALFWRPEPRSAQSDESLTILLARRDQVRARTTAPAATAPDPNLFRPERPVSVSPPAPPTSAPGTEETIPEAGAPGESRQPPASTTDRLLEAKRRARRNKR